jgi:endonuclease/exonuclease/phosphatase family metal-dependent hydrolase
MRALCWITFLLFGLTSHAQPLKLMSYNIRLDVASDGVNQWSNRSGKMTKLIARYDPDLLGLQEVLHHQLADILKALPQYGYLGVGRDDGKEKGEYSAILYRKDRFDVIWQQTSWLSETPYLPGSKSWDAAITRVLTRCGLRDRKTGKEFTYYNTHFDHVGKEARKKSAKIILATIEQEKERLPVLVTGDFNSQPDEEPYRIIIASGQLKDSRPANEAQGTYCTFAVDGPACTLIDHVFVSTEWKVLNYQVIKDNDGNYYPSDHLPVMVEVELR